jgi:hypothetical protein
VGVRGQGNQENKFKQKDQEKLHTSKSKRHLNKRTTKRFTHSYQEIKGSKLCGDTIFLIKKK